MKQRKLITASAALALSAGLAFGQAEPQQNQQSQSSSQSQQSQPAQGGQGSQSQQQQGKEASQQELKVSEQEIKQQVSDINKASKLIGMQVRNKNNENLGKISDVVVDLQSGKIAYVAMSIGGVLGVGDKLVAVPVQALTPDQGQKGLLLDIEKQRLQQAPGFSQNNWPDLNAAESGKTIGVAAGGQSQSTGASGSSSQQQQGGSESSSQQQQQQNQSDTEQKSGAQGSGGNTAPQPQP